MSIALANHYTIRAIPKCSLYFTQNTVRLYHNDQPAIIPVYYKNYVKNTNSTCQQTTGLNAARAGGVHSYHCATNG